MAILTAEQYTKRVNAYFRTAQELAEEIATLGRTPVRTTRLRKVQRSARALLHRMVTYKLITDEDAKGWWDRESVPDPKYGKLKYNQPFADDDETVGDLPAAPVDLGDEVEDQDAQNS